MRSICLFLVGQCEYLSMGMTPFSGRMFGFTMKFGRGGVDIMGYESVVALCAFMGCRVFGWDKNCYFASMRIFAEEMFPHAPFLFKNGGLELYITDSSLVDLSAGNCFAYDWVDSMFFTSVGGQVIDIYAHDFLYFSIPKSMWRGRLTFDMSDVSNSLKTPFYSSLRKVVNKASDGGHYSFDGLRSMFYGGSSDRLFLCACMYNFLEYVSGHEGSLIERVEGLFRRYPFWRDFVLYLGDDFHKYLPRGFKGDYAGVVDLVRGC